MAKSHYLPGIDDKISQLREALQEAYFNPSTRAVRLNLELQYRQSQFQEIANLLMLTFEGKPTNKTKVNTMLEKAVNTLYLSTVQKVLKISNDLEKLQIKFEKECQADSNAANDAFYQPYHERLEDIDIILKVVNDNELIQEARRPFFGRNTHAADGLMNVSAQTSPSQKKPCPDTFFGGRKTYAADGLLNVSAVPQESKATKKQSPGK